MRLTKNSTIIISRTDSIGDVILTLPMAGIIKKQYPDCKIIFLGKAYTRDIVNCSEYIDEFADWDGLKGSSLKVKADFFRNMKANVIIHVFPVREIAKAAKLADIPIRIGTISRFYNWASCNFLPRVFRKNSVLHEAQLNAQLLKPIIPGTDFSLDKLIGFYGFKQAPKIFKYSDLIDKNKINLIIHPKSRGSGREWGEHNFSELIDILDDAKFKIFVCGTESEGAMIRDSIINTHHEKITDLTGKLTLKEYISFINASDALIACSTGPLHIAAATGIHALGIYPPIRPVHPGRWGALGENVKIFVNDKKCKSCRKSNYCECMNSIRPIKVHAYLNDLYNQYNS
jgi:heptosyltransferase III